MYKTSVYDCVILPLNKIHNRAGNITIIEGNINVPFDIRRVYYLYDIPGGEARGGHAHKELYQLIIAACRDTPSPPPRRAPPAGRRRRSAARAR